MNRDMAVRRRAIRRDMAMGRYFGRREEMPMHQDYRGMSGYDYRYEEPRRLDGSNIPFELYGNVDMRDYARRRNARGQYMRDGHYPMPYMGYDYASSHSGKMSREELKEWIDDMIMQVESQYKHLYTLENVESVAKQMKIEFDKFDPMELLASTLIMATDYAKSVGQADINRNVAMAKEFLCDEDATVKYGDKLSAYYDAIVIGE